MQSDVCEVVEAQAEVISMQAEVIKRLFSLLGQYMALEEMEELPEVGIINDVMRLKKKLNDW